MQLAAKLFKGWGERGIGILSYGDGVENKDLLIIFIAGNVTEKPSCA